MTPTPYPRDRHDDPLDDRGEPGDLRALVARVLSTPRYRPRTPAPRPSHRTET
ncbi:MULTISPECIES: hypothetical protein [unclassified Streptomyces]|uniref:hypothetical protein n=1 Tax=unclassified Streptomyces TaxID=2593676 RepID=UPI0029622A78|nr:hypothetical protein [Streptomyces sp. N50]WOX15241.1 hypothetical protein R2B38_43170 [Streptomyces sp. N50]